jgi:hypothetical protein
VGVRPWRPFALEAADSSLGRTDQWPRIVCARRGSQGTSAPHLPQENARQLYPHDAGGRDGGPVLNEGLPTPPTISAVEVDVDLRKESREAQVVEPSGGRLRVSSARSRKAAAAHPRNVPVAAGPAAPSLDQRGIIPFSIPVLSKEVELSWGTRRQRRVHWGAQEAFCATMTK